MNELYQNYMERKPSPFGERLVRNWHGRMLNRFAHVVEIDLRRTRFLEVGPGHGYLAEQYVARGGQYRFDDIAFPVVKGMRSLGFEQLSESQVNFDIVWMSHVLEHSRDWVAAREMIQKYVSHLRQGGYIVVIGPDYLNWGKRFFDVDATHGYPTTLRTVAQLMKDVGLTVVETSYHRGGFQGIIPRMLFAIVALIPLSLGATLFSWSRMKSDDNPIYSWKAVLGWRQLLVVGRLGNP